MANYLNSYGVATLIREPEIKVFNNGDEVVTLRVPFDEYKGTNEKGEPIYDAIWWDVVFNRDNAKRAKELHKGDKILFEGFPKYREYESNGTKQKAYTIRATRLNVVWRDKNDAGVQVTTQTSTGAQNESKAPLTPSFVPESTRKVAEILGGADMFASVEEKLPF